MNEDDPQSESRCVCENGSTSSISRDENSLKTVNTVNIGHDSDMKTDLVLDSGATHDLIGQSLEDRVTDRQVIDDPIPLDTAGNRVWVKETGSYTVNGMLGFKDAMMAQWSKLSLLSLVDRLGQGWTWRGSGNEIVLCDPKGSHHLFKLKDGLFRYRRSTT